MELTTNVPNCALVFEGGGYRAGYTAGMALALLEEGIYFPFVCGLSAGASNTVNYLSRDQWRTHWAFTQLATLPQAGGKMQALKGNGYINGDYCYRGIIADGTAPYDWDTFAANPAQFRIQSFERDTGRTVTWGRQDVSCVEDLIDRVRASSTVPLMMPPPKVDGRYCYDGGFADGGGLPLTRIRDDGFDKVFVVRTRRRGYRKPDGGNEWARAFFWRRPLMRDAMLTRTARYNAACDMLDEWEREGKAHVFYCEDLTLSGYERDYDELMRNFESGYRQIHRDWGISEGILAEVFRDFSMRRVYEAWHRAVYATDRLEHDLDDSERKNIEMSVLQLAETLADSDLILDSVAKVLPEYAEMFRTQGEMKKAQRQIIEFKRESDEYKKNART